MTKERMLEREIHEVLDERAPQAPPNHLLQSFEFNARRTRRYPRWLALIKEPTMRTDSHLVVGSPTARLAAIVLATMLLAAGVIGASFAGARLLAADGPTVVDANGDGHYETIQEAVAAAVDGDEILIKPGRYQGGVDVGVDVVIRGEDRDGVVVEAGIGCAAPDDPFAAADCPDDPPLYRATWFAAKPYAFLLDETEAELSDLTLELGVGGVIARGGAPNIHDVTIAASPNDGFAYIYVHDGSAATISDSDLGVAVVFFEERSPATIERSSVDFVIANTGNTTRTGGPSTIRDNTTFGIRFNGEAVVEGNTIIAAPQDASEVVIEALSSDGWIIRDNHIEGFSGGTAIAAGPVGTGTISGNTLIDNQLAMDLGSGDHEVSDNTIRGGQAGISINGGSAQIADNDVEGVAGRGIAIEFSAGPTLSGNRSCGNGDNLWVADSAQPEIDETNEICEDDATE